MLSELNKKFGRDEAVVFVEGEGKLPKVILRSNNGAELEAYLFGASISSWRHHKHGQVLFMSGRADYSGTKPLRGGIPLVFPQFSSGKLPSHGFARTSNWEVKSSAVKSNGDVVIELRLTSNKAISAVWPHEFSVEYEIILGAELCTNFSVRNTGRSELAFQNALHTYFSITDIAQTRLHGFENLTYLDNLNNRAQGIETRPVINFEAEIDRVYLSAPDKLVIEDTAGKRVITIHKTGMRDAVVWNPWLDRCKAISDLDQSSYKNFVCVESGNIGELIKVAPGSTYVCSQVIDVV